MPGPVRPTALYWDPDAPVNSYKYTNPDPTHALDNTSDSQNNPVDPKTSPHSPPDVDAPASSPANLYSTLPADNIISGPPPPPPLDETCTTTKDNKHSHNRHNNTLLNTSIILNRCEAVYVYSKPKDLCSQLYTICSRLSEAAVAASGPEPQSASSPDFARSFDRAQAPAAKSLFDDTPPLLLFLAHDAPAAHLPLIRYACFLASHVPSVVTVLYPECPASPASLPDVGAYAGNDRRNPNAVRGAVPNAVFHALRSCGVAAFGPPALSPSVIDLVFSKAQALHAMTGVVLDNLKRAAETRIAKELDPNYSNIYFDKSTCRPVCMAATPEERQHEKEVFAKVCPRPLFGTAYDYYVLNFLCDLELYHTRYLLRSDTPHTSRALFEDDGTVAEDSPVDGTANCCPTSSSGYDNTNFAENDYPTIFHLSPTRIAYVKELVGNWDFEAHTLTYNDLLFAAFVMFKHVFSMRGPASSPCSSSIDALIIPDAQLFKFLLVVRDSYYPTNPYHNFRHAIDVLQASFHFMLRLSSIPEYPGTQSADRTQVAILNPLEALTMLIIAIGHDVGHPGMTNAFLTHAKSPIATAFGYKSVLESYHGAAFSRILQLHWPATQEQPVCRLIMQSVHATDMGLHFDYMSKAEEARGIVEKYGKVEAYIEEMDGSKMDTEAELTARRLEKLRFQTLVCCLLIKCADISNVTRGLKVSSRWGVVLSKEFAQVDTLEILLGLKPDKPHAEIPGSSGPSGPPAMVPMESDGEGFHIPVLALAKGQLFFINTFARPLFELVAHMFPSLRYTMDILQSNCEYWQGRVASLS